MNMLATNVSILRNKAGLSRRQLAQRLGVGETTVINIETGYLSAPPPELLEKIAGVFGVNVNGLTGTAPLEVSERSRAVYVAESISNDKPFLEVEKITDTVFIDRDKLRGYDYIGLKIKDNSMMDALICSGDIVIVQLEAPIDNGDIVVAVCKNYDAIVREYIREKSKITLRSAGDKKLYPDIVIDEKTERLVIIGKVTSAMVNF